MLALGLILATVTAVAAFAWWAERRWRDVDSYHEREHRDPPITDAGHWLGGGRF